jgi:dTDP-4-amino-4,6-dideoxygalactose transaminase
MRRRQDQYPVQSRRSYAVRIFKYSLLKLVSYNLVFGALFRILCSIGKDPDRPIASLAHNFGRQDLLESVRRQPCLALLAMLARRWRNYDSARLERRALLGELLTNSLDKLSSSPGRHAGNHSHWVFPFVTDDPDGLISALQRHGFDATQTHSLTVVPTAKGGVNSNTPVMRQMPRNAVFLPIYPELTEAAVIRMANVVLEHERESQDSSANGHSGSSFSDVNSRLCCDGRTQGRR